MDWSWLNGIAPTVATVLGGPLAGLAVDVVGKALGLSDATRDQVTETLQSGRLSGDQILALKQAEIALQAKLKEADIDLAKIDAADRDSARGMQVQTRSWVPAILALGVTGGFFAILIGLMNGSFSVANEQPLLIMLGSLGAAWASVIAYYFGSSAGSEQKTAIMAKAIGKQS